MPPICLYRHNGYSHMRKGLETCPLLGGCIGLTGVSDMDEARIVYCPDCLDNDELVIMERHEWPVEGYCKMVCPVCGCQMLGKKEEKGKDE